MASDDVIISDGDVDGVVESVRVELVEGREGDRLVLDETVCPDTTETICHLRFKWVFVHVHLSSCICTIYHNIVEN